MTGLTHVRMLVDDFAPMLAFYRDALGFRAVVDVPGTYVELDTGAARIGIFARTQMESVVGAPLAATGGGDIVLQIAVADVDAAADLLRARGVVLATTPHDQAAWMMRVFHVRDPAGRLLEMTQPLPATPR
jgi:catechol 2,3-dioxygenase-like lactoylglutathione lyase family enzyme